MIRIEREKPYEAQFAFSPLFYGVFNDTTATSTRFTRDVSTFSPLFYGVFNDTILRALERGLTLPFSPLFYGVFNDTGKPSSTRDGL